MRTKTLKALEKQVFDVAIIGGGINGAVCASALSYAGLNVALFEKNDFAGFTSQESSNLIWGGFKYLQNFEFSLVKKLCDSRNLLFKHYPNSIQEKRFLLQVPKPSQRYLFLMGAYIYWVLGSFYTKAPKLTKEHNEYFLEYSDGMLQDTDTRFILSFIKQAIKNEASVLNYAKVLNLEKEKTFYELELLDKPSGDIYFVKAKKVINASGAYADELNLHFNIQTKHQHLFSKGIHLIINKLPEQDNIKAFITNNQRLFFAMPLKQRTCIGTTDTMVDNFRTPIQQEDIEHVLNYINKFLHLQLRKKDIIATRCGVRPLAVNKAHKHQGDYLSLSRKHVIERQGDYFTIFGGKLTDCLNVGNAILKHFKLNSAFENLWFGEPTTCKLDFLAYAHKHTNLSMHTLERLYRFYQEDAKSILQNIKQKPYKEELVFLDFCLAELEYIKEHEMLVQLEDFLRRRSLSTQLFSPQELQKHNLKRLCTILFDDERMYDEYLQTLNNSTPRS